jgi:hypothetical protein
MSNGLVPYSAPGKVSPWGKALVHPATLAVAVAAILVGAFWVTMAPLAIGLGVLWLILIIVMGTTGSSVGAQRRALINKLSFKHRPPAQEAVRVLEEVETAIAAAPAAYRMNFSGLSLEVSGLVDKLLNLYPILEGLTRYRARASSDVGISDQDSVYTRSQEAAKRLEDETARTLALLHDVQGRLLMILASASGEGEDSPASRAGKLSGELAGQAKALDEARAFLEGDWNLDEKPQGA